jgi:hypothetical protein
MTLEQQVQRVQHVRMQAERMTRQHWLSPEDRQAALRTIKCSGSHSLDARLALEHPSWPTIIDSGAGVRPPLAAPEPTVLQLGSQSCRVGPHS